MRDVLEGLKNAHAKFDYVDLIGTLTRESQWHNEIHPKSSEGFKLLAEKMIPVVQQRLPDGFLTSGTWRQMSKRHRTP